MQQGHATSKPGYAAIADRLARQALSVARDAAPHRAPVGELRWPIAEALPAARLLIDDSAEPDADDRQALAAVSKTLLRTLADPAGKVTDGFGHHRPIYPLLALHLLGTSARRVCDRTTLVTLQHAAEAHMLRPPAQDDPRLAVWSRLVSRQYSIQQAEELPLASDTPAPLQPVGLNDLIDAWTYRELVGMHGMHLCALLENDEAMRTRAYQAAQYHLGHTQPDYTTYQPWALALFASDPQTTLFAEQQLHDVATHLSIEGSGSAVLPALLLADASATMSGHIKQAWPND